MKRTRFLLALASVVALMATSIGLRGLDRPPHFPKPLYDFGKQPLQPERIALGRLLFYDPILSADSTVSCASCHSPYNAFAHTDHDLSHGIGDAIGTRNAPALFNLAWQPHFMWDGAVNHLDVQALAPLSHPAEMGEEIGHVVAKLNAQPAYRAHFGKAFGEEKATGQRLLLALAQFQLTLVSAQAKYDSMKAGKAQFTDQEARGYALFQQHCNSCHREPLFSTYAFASNGLPIDTTLRDWGRGGVTLLPQDSGLFKIPSLRNLSYSFPYMHDGRFQKLGQVLQHYTGGIPASARNLSPALRQPILLSADQKVDLIAFLLTLDDKAFVFDPRHAFPRKNP